MFQRQTRRSCKSANNAERAERGRIDPGSDWQKMITLTARDCGAGERSHLAIHGVGVVTALLQCNLNAGHDLMRRKAVVTVNRFVVPVIRVRIVTPGRIPPPVIPTPPAPVEKDDGDAVVSPPIGAMVMAAVIRVVQPSLSSTVDVPAPMTETGGCLRIELVFGDCV